MLAAGQPGSAPPNVVVDTSVWISRILTTDINHGAARNWIDPYLLGGGTLVAPMLFVIEVAAAVSRQTKSPGDAHSAVSQLYGLSGLRLVQIDQTIINTATDLAANLGLRGADALFVALATQLNIPLLSFDSEQLQRPAMLISTIRP